MQLVERVAADQSAFHRCSLEGSPYKVIGTLVNQEPSDYMSGFIYRGYDRIDTVTYNSVYDTLSLYRVGIFLKGKVYHITGDDYMESPGDLVVVKTTFQEFTKGKSYFCVLVGVIDENVVKDRISFLSSMIQSGSSFKNFTNKFDNYSNNAEHFATIALVNKTYTSYQKSITCGIL